MLFIEKWLPRQFFLNLRWQFISNAAQGLFGGLYLILLGRALGVTQFGIFSLATSLVAITFFFVELRLQEIVIRYTCLIDSSFNSESEGRRIADLFYLDIALRSLILLSIFILLTVLRIIDFVNTPPEDIIIACAIVHFLSKAGNSSAIGLMRVMDRFDAAAMLMAFEWFLKLASLAILVKLVQPTVVQAVVLAGFIGMLSNATLMTLAVKSWNRSYPGTIRIRIKGMRSRLVQMRRYLFSNLGISLSDLLVKDLDVAITGAFVSVESVGIYKMSKNIVSMMWRVVDPFFLVLMPELRRMQAEHNSEVLFSFIKKVAILLLVISLGIFALTWAIIALFGTHIFGPDFSNISTLFPYMGIWVVLCSPLIWAHPLAVAAGRPELPLTGSIFANLIGLAVFVPLVYWMGIVGAGVGWSLTSILAFFSTAYLCKRAGMLKRE